MNARQLFQFFKSYLSNTDPVLILGKRSEPTLQVSEF
jgi:hypothetical protein